MNSSIFSQRLREALNLRRLNSSEFAQHIGVSKQTVSAYLNKIKIPSTQTLEIISQTLNLPISYFNWEENSNLKRTSNLNFRKYKGTSKKDELYADSIERVASSSFFALERFVNFPKTNLPDFGIDDFLELSNQTIETWANKTRTYWGLKDGPIGNMTELLESHGILVFNCDIPEKIDAFSCWLNDSLACIITSNQKSAVRLRLDLAHELCHLILHKNEPLQNDDENKKFIHQKKEEQAQCFAGCFLMPNTSFPKEASPPSFERFKLLKNRWGVSIQAMTERCRELGMISPPQREYIYRKLGKNRKCEPLDSEIEKEKPCLINEALKLLIKNKLSKEDIFNSVRYNAEDIQAALGFDESIFDIKNKNIVYLKTV